MALKYWTLNIGGGGGGICQDNQIIQHGFFFFLICRRAAPEQNNKYTIFHVNFYLRRTSSGITTLLYSDFPSMLTPVGLKHRIPRSCTIPSKVFFFYIYYIYTLWFQNVGCRALVLQERMKE